jgi:SAM-dependent methyltransferase
VQGFERREELRDTFGGMAAVYDEARPAYPDALVDDLVSLAGLAPGDTVLEVGAGTGIATAQLAARGLDVVAVERAPELARVARTNLAAWPRVEVLTGAFETAPAEGRFDAVVAFSAFHWIDPETRYARAAALLREGGVHAVADARMMPAESDAFFADSDEDYVGILGAAARRPGAPVVDSLRGELLACGLFDHLAERRYRWDVRRDTAGFLALLDSFPWYAALDPGLRAELYRRLTRRIEARPSRTVSVTFEAVLDVARKR